MRLIGHLDNEAKARVFSDYLYVKGIDNEVEADRDGAWALWVCDEDLIDKAVGLLAQFRENPGNLNYQQFSAIASEQRAAEAEKNAVARRRHYDRRKLFPATVFGVGPLTAALVAIAVAVGVFSKGAFSREAIDPRVVRLLSIAEYEVEGRHPVRRSGLPEVRSGQVWRLVTPIFIHLGPVHLIFNMLCLLDFGTMIERRQGARVLLGLVLLTAVTSNVAQNFMRGPDFGGMSGVVYGLLGYIWMRGKHDPNSRLFLHPMTLMMAMIWFFACLVQVIPGIANTAHAVGLGVGMAWGFVSAIVARRI